MFHEIGVTDELIEELMPGFGGDTSGADHVRQFFDPVIGQRSDCFFGSDIDTDDVSIGQVVVVAEDCFKKFCILTQHKPKPRAKGVPSARCSDPSGARACFSNSLSQP